LHILLHIDKNTKTTDTLFSYIASTYITQRNILLITICPCFATSCVTTWRFQRLLYAYGQNIINYRPPRGSNGRLQATLHIDTIIVCRSIARGQMPTPQMPTPVQYLPVPLHTLAQCAQSFWWMSTKTCQRISWQSTTWNDLTCEMKICTYQCWTLLFPFGSRQTVYSMTGAIAGKIQECPDAETLHRTVIVVLSNV